MKKIFGIIIAYTLFCLAVSLGLSFFVFKDIPELLSGTENAFLLRRGFIYFIEYLPSILFCSFLVAWTIVFEKYADGIRFKFSNSIFYLFGKIIISSVILVAVLTASKEIASPILNFQQKRAVDSPVIFREYKELAKKSFDAGDMDLASEYSSKALGINSKDNEMLFIHDHSFAYLNSVKPVFNEAEEDDGYIFINPSEVEGETVSSLIEKSRAAAKENEWFDSHYYAELAIQVGDGYDLNLDEARILSANAWNKLQEPFVIDMEQNEEQRLYNQKKAAYIYLMNGDNLGAYYKFLEILDNFENAQFDPDVTQFMKVATERVTQQNFFTDEVENLRKFETNTDVYFSLPFTDGSREVVFIKGITPVKNGGSMVQYLRGLSIYSFDKNGFFQQSVFAPYGKMLVESVSTFDSATKKRYGLVDSLDKVPYILLNGVNRLDKTKTSSPVFNSINPKAKFENSIVIPISANDFNLACEASIGAEDMNLFSLATVAKNAHHFGYSSEIYGSTLLTRLAYPLVLLIIFVFLACVAWNYRLEKGQLFSFAWVLVMPFATAFLYFSYRCLIFFMKILNFVLFSSFGFFAVLGSIILCIIALIIVSVMFLSRTNH